MTLWSFLWQCLRVLLVCGAVLIVLVIGGVGWVLSGQRYKTFLTEQLSARLHARVTILQSDLSIAQGLGLHLHGVEIHPEKSDQSMFTAERMTVLIDIGALVRGQLLFHRIEWEKPRIALVETPAGLFVFFTPLLPGSDTAAPAISSVGEWWTPTLALRYVKISDGEISYRRKGRAAPFVVTRTHATLIFPPEQGVQVQFEGELGAKGALGRVALRTSLPHWEVQSDMSQLRWTGQVRCDRLVLRELGRLIGHEWPVATLAFAGQAAGKGLIPDDLMGTIHIEKAHFGSVQVQSGALTLKKFLLEKIVKAEEVTSPKPVTWMTLLQTASAELEIKEVRARWKDFAPQLHLLTGTGTLRGGDLTIADVSGKLGSASRLLAVNGTLKQIASAKGPIPDLLVYAELDVQKDGPDLLKSLAKTGFPNITSHVQKPQGFARIEMAVRTTGPGGSLTSDGSIQLREVAFAVPPLQTEVRDFTGTIIVSDTGLLFDTVALKIGHSTLQMTGQVNAYRSLHRQADLDLTADVDLRELGQLISVGGQFWPVSSFADGDKSSHFVTNPQGHAAVRLKIRTGEGADTLCDGSITLQHVALQVPRWNLLVADLSGQLQLEKDVLSTDGLTFLLGTAALRAQGSLRNYLTFQRTGEVQLSFTDVADVDVSVLLPPNLIHPQGGTLGGRVDLIRVENGEWRTKGEVTLNRIQLDPLPKTLRPLTVEEGMLTWEGKSGIFVITRGSVTGSAFHGQGRIHSFTPLHLEAALAMPVFDVESIFRLEERPPESEHKPKEERVVVQVDVTAEHLTYKTLRAERVRASCHWHGRQADIHVAEAEIAGGQVQGDAVFWPDFNAVFVVPRMTAVHVPQLLTAFGVSTDVLTGDLSGGGQVYIPDRHQWRNLAQWQAQLSLAVVDGVAQRIPILVRLWSVVSLQAVLKLQLPSLPTEGLAFSSLNGDFALGGGLAVTKNLSLDSSAVRLDASGEINLAERTVNLKTSLSLLHGITSSVAKVPIAGQVLALGADLLTTVPFRVSGPYDDPTVIPLVVDLGSR